jgi:hypothetical protein
MRSPSSREVHAPLDRERVLVTTRHELGPERAVAYDTGVRGWNAKMVAWTYLIMFVCRMGDVLTCM